MPVILITGAAGQIGTMLRPRLAAPGRILRLADIAPIEAGPGEEAVTASVTDLPAMTAACDGVDAVIHLGGIPLEADWDRILDVNIHGTYAVLEAARRAGVPRVIIASSNHAVGFAPLGDTPRSPTTRSPPPTPSTGSPRWPGRRSGRCTAAATAWTSSACGSWPAWSGPGTCGSCPPGCPRTTAGGCSRPA